MNCNIYIDYIRKILTMIIEHLWSNGFFTQNLINTRGLLCRLVTGSSRFALVLMAWYQTSPNRKLRRISIAYIKHRYLWSQFNTKNYVCCWKWKMWHVCKSELSNNAWLLDEYYTRLHSGCSQSLARKRLTKARLSALTIDTPSIHLCDWEH